MLGNLESMTAELTSVEQGRLQEWSNLMCWEAMGIQKLEAGLSGSGRLQGRSCLMCWEAMGFQKLEGGLSGSSSKTVRNSNSGAIQQATLQKHKQRLRKHCQVQGGGPVQSGPGTQ